MIPPALVAEGVKHIKELNSYPTKGRILSG